ncbi:glyoxalase/bleomycin resistance/extradiol dioxygenase family protein [Paraburkholderia dipogonis]|uniref:Glyoxalase/bleomycin resistance/extradiol dioxygenase family protein n=2 Tax=Paraburkholderia dipogonis TaxID=1211383 RepID=A0A4Y8MY40_9BURK|nr:glyoxalase/bleomycin resistance/extradiol dioxygenase family protein [Paraburkholderia dipogonis]
MKITHVALWTNDLDRASDFYRDMFGAEIGETYKSERTQGFSSRFARLPEGPAIEIMHLPRLAPHSVDGPRAGWAHIAISLGTEDAVIALARRMESDGALVSGPRWTGDGYFEAVVSDPDGNFVEVTI